MVNRDFFIALNQLENEGKIDKELVISSLESAIAQAYKRSTERVATSPYSSTKVRASSA